MLKVTNKICLSIWGFIYILLAVLLGSIIVLSITEPQNNLFPWQMAVGTVIGTFLLLCAFTIYDRLPCDRLKRNPYIYAALLILFGIALYVLSCNGRNAEWSFQDYEEVWEAAAALAQGRELSAHSQFYFQTYANNIKPLIYLTALFRISRVLQFKDPYFLILIPSICQVLGAAWSVGVLVGDSREERQRYRIPILLLFMCALPIWANVQAYYTDSMSFGVGVFALSLIRLSFESSSRLKSGLLLVSAGVSTGIGITIKVTAIIPLIAGFIVFCFLRRPLKKWKHVGLFILCVILTWKLTDLWAGSYEIWNAAKGTCDPAINWIALGMKGCGNYLDNADYVTFTHTIPTKAEKTGYALQYILENRDDFWNISHLIKKIRCNFASGQFGAAVYSYYSYKEHNPVGELFSPWGKHYWRTSQFSFCFIFSAYTVYLLGAVTTLRRLIKTKEIHIIKTVADLSLLGIILFLMMWEANNRQLYNQIPMIILGAVLNARYVICRQRRGISSLYQSLARKII